MYWSKWCEYFYLFIYYLFIYFHLWLIPDWEMYCPIQQDRQTDYREILRHCKPACIDLVLLLIAENAFPAVHAHVVILFYSSWEQRDSYTSYSHRSVVNIGTLKSCIRLQSIAVLLSWLKVSFMLHVLCYLIFTVSKLFFLCHYNCP